MKKYLLFAMLLIQTNVFAQVPSQLAVKANIENYGSKYPQEKIYIQFDKPAYAPGQTVWFKAYVMNGFDPGNLSKTLYIDFSDEEGTILMHGVYPIWDASAAGNFEVAATYKAKSIHARAYTQWMLNFDSAFLYTKDILVIPTNSDKGSEPAAKVDLMPSLQFFPEGGDYVEGLTCKIAFKANYQNGMPANISGTVTDSQGGLVDSLKSLHDGMGFFYLQAAPGKTYTAKWAGVNGATYQTPLPLAKPMGATIEISLKKAAVWFMVKRPVDVPAELNEMHVVATMQQQVVYMAPVNLTQSPMIGGTIPLAQSPTGIMQVTLFDADWKPVAERIVFVNNKNYRFTPVISLDTVGVTKRGKNVISVDVPDSMQANLSVSVTDAGLGTDSTGDIVSHLLLTADLKGRVYHPGYYFANNSDSLAQQLDLVMLTNGWRRYKWDDVVKGTAPVIKYPSDTAWLTFSGQLNGATPKQLKNISSILAIVSQNGKDSGKQYLTLPLASNGSFSKPGFVFFDTLKVYYQFMSKSGSLLTSNPEVNFNSGGVPPLLNVRPAKNNAAYNYLDTTGIYRAGVLATEEARLQQLLKSTTLKEVTVKTRVKSKMQLMDEEYTSGMFGAGGHAAQFDLVNDPYVASAPTIFEYLMGKVPGLKIARLPGPHAYIVSYRNADVGLYVDEVQREIVDIAALDVNNIAYVKVFQGSFFGGSSGGTQGGAVAIYTRKGGEESSNAGATGLPYKLVAGYTAVKEFYTPNYGELTQQSMQGDIRSTLYWNPLILTAPKSHIIKLRFYNNDVTNRMRVVLEGVSSDGKLTRVEKIIE